jgi:predicted phosphodiesterase
MVHDACTAVARRGFAALGFLVALASPAAALAVSYVYVAEGHPLYHLPGIGEPDVGWAEPGFVPGADWVWSDAGFGVGYGDGDDLTVLEDMQGSYLTVYVVASFTAGPEVAALTHLELSALFDDGFVAYLNGVEVARSHMPAGTPFHDLTASSHEATDGAEVFTIDPWLLVDGENVLAVEVHNSSLGSSDLSFIPTLWGYDEPPIQAAITIGPLIQQVGRRRALVAWETDVAAPSRVAYGPDPALGLVVEDSTERLRHEVWLEGLAPDSAVHYRIESATLPSPAAVFRTERDRAAPHRIVVLGDTRSNHDDHRSVVAGVEAEAPDLVLHVGDLVADGETAAGWGTFFDIEAALLRSVPEYTAIGNHEGNGSLYLEHLALPPGSPSPELYYSFRYSTSAFVAVDVYQSDIVPGSTQHTWIADTLEAFAADPAVRHVFVYLHHGPYDSGPHGSQTGVRDHLVPLFEAYGVDMVFAGHDHTYERSTVSGIVYVVTGGGGAPLYSSAGDWWTEVTEASLHYCVVDVDGPLIHFVARRADGSTLDELTLGEDPGECTAPADCDGRVHDLCEVDEAGVWGCVHGACIWSCTLEEPEPDGDADVDADSDAGEDADVDTDGGTDADASAEAGVDSDTGPPGGLGGGCDCSALGRSPARLLGLGLGATKSLRARVR